MSFNKLTVVGNLGRDPELRYTPQGTAVCDFSVATTESKKDKDGNYVDNTTWFKCIAWGKQAENANKYLSKGSQVYLDGRLSEEKWNDRDGNERTSLVVNVSDIQFLSKKVATSEEPEESFSGTKTTAVKAPKGDTDIPF